MHANIHSMPSSRQLETCKVSGCMRAQGSPHSEARLHLLRDGAVAALACPAGARARLVLLDSTSMQVNPPALPTPQARSARAYSNYMPSEI
jgi:hypothetical protein